MTTQEITVKFLKERMVFDNGDRGTVIVGSALLIDEAKPFAIGVKGPAREGELRENQTYILSGSHTSYTNKRTGQIEKQFSFTSFTRPEPSTSEGIISYILQHGEGCGVGQRRAETLYNSFGQDAVRICREEPDRAIEALLANNLRITPEQMEKLSYNLEKDKKTEQTKIDLSGLLNGKGFFRSIVDQCIARWGINAPKVIRRDPYKLMVLKNAGAGFKRCDAMYLEMGLNPSRLKRQALCAWYSIARDTSGSTWYPEDYPRAFIQANISGCDVRTERAIQLATRSQYLAAIPVNDHGDIITDKNTQPKQIWYAEYKKASNELDIANEIISSRSERMLWPKVESIREIDDHQRGELRKAFQGSIGLLGGSPGTGKTFCVASLVVLLKQTIGLDHIVIGCPTGKSAVRVSENLADPRFNIPLRAKTWASIMMNPKSIDGKKILIGDETSMNCTEMMASIMRIRKGKHLLLVGDVNQLPPVGHGAPFRDLIAAGVPYGELTEIKRNSGGIVEFCAAIRDKKPWFEHTGDNLLFDEQLTPESQIKSILDWIAQVKDAGLDPIWDCQVVCAVNGSKDSEKGSQVGRQKLNAILQAHLNKNPGIERVPFRIGDKIVNTKNGYFKMVESDGSEDAIFNQRGEVYCANGEQAKVIKIDTSSFIAELNSPFRVIQVGFAKSKEAKEKNDDELDNQEEKTSTGCDWDLAYAISVHKCVHPDTIVECDQGLLPIRLIAPNGIIGTPNGSQSYGNAISYEKRDSLKITTEDGHEIIVTADHRCEAWNGTSYVLEEAKHLAPGQWVRQKFGVSIEPTAPSMLPDCQVITPVSTTEDFAEFCGLMVADGTIYGRGFRYGKANEEVVRRFEYLCESLFEIKAKVWHIPGKVTGMWACEINSADIARWLMRLGGMSPNAKAMPECILRSTSSIQAKFLRGLFEDGSVHQKNGSLDHINWTTSSYELCQQVRIMLLRFGIASSINSQRKKQHSLYIYSTFAKKFADAIGLISYHKIERLKLPIGPTNGESQRFKIPINRDDCEMFRKEIVETCSVATYENLRKRKTISRSTARKLSSSIPGFSGILEWHHSKIRSIEPMVCPAMCVEVKNEHRFLQNGFPWGNSQGSDWPWVLVILDDYAGARRICDCSWLYTAASRGKEKVVLIGQRSTADRMIRVSNIYSRKTFLQQWIHYFSAAKCLAEV